MPAGMDTTRRAIHCMAGNTYQQLQLSGLRLRPGQLTSAARGKMGKKEPWCDVEPGIVLRSPGVWTVEGRMNFNGLGKLPVRMTILALTAGQQSSAPDLLIVSPLAYNESLYKEVAALGAVKFVLAPNTWHHLWAGQWAAQVPGAQLLAPAALADKRKDFTVHHTLPPAGPIPGIPEGVLSFYHVPGFLNEVVVLHHPSKTLVLTDIAYNFSKQAAEKRLPGAPLSWVIAAVGGCRCCSLTAAEGIFPLTDPKGLKQVLEQILDADWDAVIMAHGTPVLSGGHQALRDGTYAWVSRIVERRGRPWVVKVGMPLLKVVGVAVLGVAVAGQVKRIRKQQGGSK